MTTTKAIKRRSDADILQFIRDLPGGNVPQYAKLLNTTAIRINTLLNTKEGSRLARRDLVVAPERGLVASWSFTRNRGSLRARDVDQMSRDDKLPKFITNLLEKVHPQFRDDALNFLREALDQTSNHSSFEEQMTSYMEQDKHRVDHIVQGELRIAQLDGEIARFDRLLGQAKTMATLLEHRSAEVSRDPGTVLEFPAATTVEAVEPAAIA